MAGLEGTSEASEAESSSKALKKLDDAFRRIHDFLVDIGEAEDLFKYEMDAATNRGPNGLLHLETVPERANHLKALLVPTLVNQVKRHVKGIVDIQETLTTCDAFFRVVCANRASEEVAMASMQQVQLRLAEAQAVKQRRTIRRHGENTCRHFCEHHQEVMDNALWRKLPKELVERICAFLPFSKTLELTKLSPPIANSCAEVHRLPLISTGFKQFCAEAHRDLFGVLMYHSDSMLYRLAVSNSRLEKWFHMELSIPEDYGYRSFGDKLIFGHDGGLISILPCSFEYFEDNGEPPSIYPSIYVYNPLTRDEKKVPLSSSTSAKRIKPILLQLVMNRETGCYKLNLVTQSGEPTEAQVFYSEVYDSKSGLWSTLDSGFLRGHGVVGDKAIYFDCTSKCFCDPHGKLFQDGKLVRKPHFDMHLHGDHMPRYHYFTFVGDNRFEMKFVESVLQNRWVKSSKPISYEMEEPPEGYVTRLLACGRYLLVVSDDPNTKAFDHRHQRMVLYDRETCEEAYDLPQFLTEDLAGDEEFMTDNLHFICDLKWDVVP